MSASLGLLITLASLTLAIAQDDKKPVPAWQGRFKATRVTFQTNASDISLRNRQNSLLEEMNLRLNELRQGCDLTTEQEEKLALAGKGVVDRYLRVMAEHEDMVDSLETFAEKLAEETKEPRVMPDGNDAIIHEKKSKIAALVGVIQRTSAQVFDQDPRWEKMVDKVLAADQRTRLHAFREERRAFQIRVLVGDAIGLMDTIVFLSTDQRNAMTKLLIAQVSAEEVSTRERIKDVVLEKVAKLSTPELAPILKLHQLDTWRKRVGRAMKDGTTTEPPFRARRVNLRGLGGRNGMIKR